MTAGVYQIKCLVNGMTYYGESKNVEKRLYDHRIILGMGTHANSALQADFNSYGLSLFEFQMIKIEDDKEARLEFESELVKSNPFHYNQRGRGIALQDHHRKNLSKVKTGKPVPWLTMKGKKHSDETKQKMSVTRKNKVIYGKDSV